MRKPLALLFAALMLLAGACGDNGTSRSDARDDLIEEGATEEQADCLLDAMDDLGIDYDADEEDVSEGQQDEFFDMLSECAAP